MRLTEPFLVGASLLALGSTANAQSGCGGQAPAGKWCGNPTSGPAIPGWYSPLSELSPTGTNTNLRVPLSGTTTIYVNATGGSAACGVTGVLTCGVGTASPANPTNPATPFDTTQHAIAYLAKSIDTQGQSVTINLAHGASLNYGFNCLGQPLFGVVTFNVIGDFNNPTAVTVIAPNGGYAIQALDQCVPSLSSFRIADQGSAAGAVFAQQQGIVDLRSITVGSWNTGGAVSIAWDGGIVNWLGQDASSSITNTLDGTSYGQIFQAQFGGIVNFRSAQIAVPNTITIGGGQSGATNISGYMRGLIAGGTFTGAGVAGSTGSRCNFTAGAFSNIDPNTAFFGSSNCFAVGFSITNSISGDVALNNTANYFTGPQVAQGSNGTWQVSGTASLTDSAGAATFICKLWDGTNVVDAAPSDTNGAGKFTSIALSGVVSSPLGNLRISCKDNTSTSGSITFNSTGTSRDGTITAVRVQ